MAKAESGWVEEGHEFLEKHVTRTHGNEGDERGVTFSKGVISAWLPPTAADPFVDSSGKRSSLFKVRFFSGELAGDVEDLEEHEVVESLPGYVPPPAPAQ